MQRLVISSAVRCPDYMQFPVSFVLSGTPKQFYFDGQIGTKQFYFYGQAGSNLG